MAYIFASFVIIYIFKRLLQINIDYIIFSKMNSLRRLMQSYKNLR